MNPFRDQAKFMRASGQTVRGANPEQARMYGRLVDEEFQELLDAVRDDDQVEQLDAVIDLMVVLIGFGLSRGWDMEGAWHEVMRSNLSKIDPITGTVRKREDGKILKPADWTPPSLGHCLPKEVA